MFVEPSRESAGLVGMRTDTGGFIVEGRNSRRSFDWGRHGHSLQLLLEYDDSVQVH